MNLETIFAAGLDFLKRTTLVYLGVALFVACLFAMPEPATKYLGLDVVLTSEYRGLISGIGLLSFCLWFTSLWPALKSKIDQIVKRREKTKFENEIYVQYQGLPKGTRAIIGFYMQSDEKMFKGTLGEPGTQSLMDTGWVWYDKKYFHFYDHDWQSLKKFRPRIREEFDLLAKELSPEVKEVLTPIVQRKR